MEKLHVAGWKCVSCVSGRQTAAKLTVELNIVLTDPILKKKTTGSSISKVFVDELAF